MDLHHCVYVTCAARSGFWLRHCKRLLTYGPDSRLSISPGLAVISSSSDCIPEERERRPHIKPDGLCSWFLVVKQCVFIFACSHGALRVGISSRCGGQSSEWICGVTGEGWSLMAFSFIWLLIPGWCRHHRRYSSLDHKHNTDETPHFKTQD